MRPHACSDAFRGVLTASPDGGALPGVAAAHRDGLCSARHGLHSMRLAPTTTPRPSARGVSRLRSASIARATSPICTFRAMTALAPVVH